MKKKDHTSVIPPTWYTQMRLAHDCFSRCMERCGPAQRKPTYGEANSMIEELDAARRALVVVRDGEQEAPR